MTNKTHTDAEIVQAMARAYCITAMRQGFHVDQTVCETRMKAALAAQRAMGLVQVSADAIASLQTEIRLLSEQLDAANAALNEQPLRGED